MARDWGNSNPQYANGRASRMASDALMGRAGNRMHRDQEFKREAGMKADLERWNGITEEGGELSARQEKKHGKYTAALKRFEDRRAAQADSKEGEINFAARGSKNVDRRDLLGALGEGWKVPELIQAVDDSGLSVGKHADALLAKYRGMINTKNGTENDQNPTDNNTSNDGTNPANPAEDNGTGSAPGNGSAGDGQGGQSMTNTTTQDNDISGNTVNGNNNTFSQDNSVRNTQYGGDSRTFNYGGGGPFGSGASDSLYGNPVSAATMAGYYETSDSPGVAAGRISKYIDLNRAHQEQNMKDHYKDPSKFNYRAMADSARAFNPLAMQERLDRVPLIDRDRATVRFGDTFGDFRRWEETATPWMMPDPSKKVESDAADIAEDYADRIDDL